MEGLFVFLSIILIIVIIYIDYWIAKQFYEIACIKGYDNKKYFWIPFLFNITGYLLIIALPAKSIAVSKSKHSSDELPEL